VNIEMERIDENTRVVLSETGKVFINRDSRGHDLWTISFEKGPVNKVLEGSYTSPQNAFERIKNYLENNQHRQRVAKAKVE
jgi:hypothetical protein